MAIPPELVGWIIPVSAVVIGLAGYGLALYSAPAARSGKSRRD